MAKFLKNNAGTITEEATVGTSSGSGDASKIAHLDANGRFDQSFMPTGIGADTKVITASEALSAGDFVNIHNSTGAKARKADASVSGKEAHGFVKAAVANGANATVYFEGANDQVTGQTPGPVFLSATTPGAATSTAPSGSGQVVQRIGFAVATTEINFQSQPPIVLA
jgi:hypothetical protein